MSPVKQQVYMYLCYILVITYMFSANVQEIITSHLTIQTVQLPHLSPVVLEHLTLQLSSYRTSKRWWLPTSWLKDVRSLKTWIHNVIAVITRNVAIKQYCLLQVLVAALLLASCTAFIKRYPDPLDCQKYHLRIDDEFYNLTCPPNFLFDQHKEQCTLTADCVPPNIMWSSGTDCSLNELSYYCESVSPGRFTYCTPDGLKIIKNVPCRNSADCPGVPGNMCLRQ
jgi:hypothetical protein